MDPKQDIFKYLPPEIIISILSRLPLRTIAISKCVCKSWRDLLETDYFVDSHLAKSVSTLAVLMPDEVLNSNWCRLFELEDELDRRYNLLTKFEFPHNVTIEGSANGLLLLYEFATLPDTLYICNPITRHYAEIDCPEEAGTMCYYRFGVSKITGQYKVVSINSKSECRVYTLGTASWRLVEASASVHREGFCLAAFVNGSLFWSVTECNDDLISCFDLETECFSSFCAPASCTEFFVLKDCLCFCKWEADEIVIWLMLDNGFEKCWRKEYVRGQGPSVNDFADVLVYPIKAFGNGDILMLWDEDLPHCYCNETKTVEELVGLFDAPGDLDNWVLLTPSFLSLEGLGMRSVISF